MYLTQVDRLAHNLSVDLAVGRYVDHQVAKHLRRAPETPLVGKRSATRIAVLDGAGGTEVAGRHGDPVLGELAKGGFDLATAADAPTAAYRVEVYPKPAGRVEHRGPLGNMAPVTGRRENH